MKIVSLYVTSSIVLSLFSVSHPVKAQECNENRHSETYIYRDPPSNTSSQQTIIWKKTIYGNIPCEELQKQENRSQERLQDLKERGNKAVQIIRNLTNAHVRCLQNHTEKELSQKSPCERYRVPSNRVIDKKLKNNPSATWKDFVSPE